MYYKNTLKIDKKSRIKCLDILKILYFNGRTTLQKEVKSMGRHDFIVGTLVKTGFRASLKGFDQFCSCVEMYSDDRTATIDSIYNRVADDFNCTKSSIEKNLRRLFSTSEACKVIGRLFDIDFRYAGNKEIVAMFSNYFALKRDKYECDK